MTTQNLAPEDLQVQIAEMLSEGGTLGWAQNFADADYEAFYALGYNLYAQARYQDAKRVFGHLVLHNHLEPRYLTAYASSLQMIGDYRYALQFYSLASLLDIENPLLTFHSAECLLALNLVGEAKEALAIVLSQSKATQFDELKTRTLAMLLLLDQPQRSTQSSVTGENA